MTRIALIPFPLILTALAGCQPAHIEDPVLDGLPPAWTQVEQRLSEVPQLGRIDFETRDSQTTFQTVDLTVGAIDSSVWIHDNGPTMELTIVGYPPEDEQLTGTGRIEIKARLDNLNDATPDITSVVIYDDQAWSGQGPAAVTAWFLTPLLNPEDSFGTLEAVIVGNLCHDGRPLCVPYTATIDTQVDFREF